MKAFRGLVVLGVVVSSCMVFAAQPPRFSYQARLTNGSGVPLTGNHACVFRLYEGGTLGGANSGTLKYEESASFDLADGIVNHAIGTGVPNGGALSDAVFATSADVYVQTAVDGNVVLPRTRLESVPFAINAAHAANGELRTVLDPSQPGFTPPFVITQPGSYYLAGNIAISGANGADGIEILCSDVTLDLNGFTISSDANPTSGSGVLVKGDVLNNITIRNGHIISQGVISGHTVVGPGFTEGIVTFPLTIASVIENVNVSDVSVHGVSNTGIYLGTARPSSANNCIVSVANSGINATSVLHCSATESSEYAIAATVAADCFALCIWGSGITADTVTNSYGETTGGDFGSGISAKNATGCHGISTTNTGLFVSFNALNCIGDSTSGEGLKAYTAEGCAASTVDNIAMDIAVNATNCFASNSSATHPALKVTGTANTCGGGNAVGGSAIAIQATIGIACGLYSGVTNIPAAGKFLGTP